LRKFLVARHRLHCGPGRPPVLTMRKGISSEVLAPAFARFADGAQNITRAKQNAGAGMVLLYMLAMQPAKLRSKDPLTRRLGLAPLHGGVIVLTSFRTLLDNALS
jgi:hypothetical protein